MSVMKYLDGIEVLNQYFIGQTSSVDIMRKFSAIDGSLNGSSVSNRKFSGSQDYSSAGSNDEKEIEPPVITKPNNR
jgi:hypothetical protein